MNREDAELIVTLVCSQLDISPPLLNWTNRINSGRYFSSYKRKGRRMKRPARIIAGSRQTYHDPESVVLHELAHHVEYERNNGRRASNQSHGPSFSRALTDVATAWYGDPLKYAWDKEYRSVRKRGPLPPRGALS